jgi:hypothetical protein
VGTPFEADPQSDLLRECLDRRSLTHVRQEQVRQHADLACVPILSATGHLSGVLVVRQIAFLSLNSENLELLQVLFNDYANGIAQQALVEPVQQQLPSCPYDFALELARLAHMRGNSGVRSSLVGLVCPPSALGDALMEQLIRRHRKLDQLWMIEQDNARVAILLLPLTDDGGVDGYFVRIEQAAQTQFGTSLADAGVVSYRAAVEFNAPGYGLTQIVSRCHGHV